MTSALMTTLDQKGVAAQTEKALDEGFGQKDILIPRLLLMQNTSAYVSDEKAKFGGVVNSITLEELAGFQSTVELIPLHVFKTWRIYDMSDEHRAAGGKLVRVDAFTAQNAEQEWEGTEKIKNRAGEEKEVPVRRDLSYNAFVLSRKEVATLDAFPMNIIFKRTSAIAGKQLTSLIYRLDAANQPIFAKSILLGSRKEKKESNTFAVFEVKAGTITTPEEREIASSWRAKVKSAEVKVDESDDKEAEAPVATPTMVGTTPEDSPY